MGVCVYSILFTSSSTPTHYNFDKFLSRFAYHHPIWPQKKSGDLFVNLPSRSVRQWKCYRDRQVLVLYLCEQQTLVGTYMWVRLYTIDYAYICDCCRESFSEGGKHTAICTEFALVLKYLFTASVKYRVTGCIGSAATAISL